MTTSHALQIGLLALLAGVSPVHAADKITGNDAAYMDWAVINCGSKTTETEHSLAEAANATGGAAFQSSFQEQRRKLLAPITPTAQATRCEEIKDWYGPSGSRIVGLLTWPQAGPPGVSVGKKTNSGDSGGKGGGRRRGGGS